MIFEEGPRRPLTLESALPALREHARARGMTMELRTLSNGRMRADLRLPEDRPCGRWTS